MNTVEPAVTRRSGARKFLYTLLASLVAIAVIVPAAPAAAADAATFGELETALAAGGTVVLTGDIAAAANTLAVPATATLDLNGNTLTTDTATLATGVSLTVMDSGAGGEWTATATTSDFAGIQTTGATLIINGGAVTATGFSGAGIGGGGGGDGGTTVVNGGTVVATGDYAAGIGGDNQGTGGTTTITGGTVTATGDSVGAGIGGGGTGADYGDGGTTTITGGTVTAIGGSTGAGIGGGWRQPGGTLLISGASTIVNVTTGTYSAGIGGGRNGDGGTITIDGGTVTVNAVMGAASNVGAAAIGGGECGDAGAITINGGTVTADSRIYMTGDTGAAGIGSGDGGDTNSGPCDPAVGSAGAITINGGTVTATASGGGAGIGGGNEVDGGTITINGGTVTATGGEDAAGIGGGREGNGGSITINGGTVTANGGYAAAGIGGGFEGKGGTVTITTTEAPTTVYAEGEFGAAGIGGGNIGGGGTVSIGEGAEVTAVHGSGASALGRVNGGGAPASTITIAGQLTLLTGNNLVVAGTDEATITPTGKVTGAGGVSVGSANLLVNQGIITNTTVSYVDRVTVNNFPFEFDANFTGAAAVDDVRVFATTFDDGERSLPIPTRSGYVITGWNTEADGSGDAVTPTSALTSGDTLYAQWSDNPYVISPESDTVTAGGDIQFTVNEIVDLAEVDVTSDFSFSSSSATDAEDVVTPGLMSFVHAGARTITATLDSDPSITVTAEVTVVGDAAHPTALDITPSAPNVEVGGFLTFNIELTDPYGNPLPSGAVVLTSSYATDIIDGNKVTFPTASTHTITATLGSLVTLADVNVVPAGSLASTGADPALPLGAAAMLLLFGSAIMLGRRWHASHR